jgi:hypothetical protein
MYSEEYALADVDSDSTTMFSSTLYVWSHESHFPSESGNLLVPLLLFSFRTHCNTLY